MFWNTVLNTFQIIKEIVIEVQADNELSIMLNHVVSRVRILAPQNLKQTNVSEFFKKWNRKAHTKSLIFIYEAFFLKKWGTSR